MSSSGTPVDKVKQAQCDMLMEKLKTKSSQYKPFFEMAKALRMTILEKRYAIDNVERSHLQKCLDVLQQSIKVNSLQAMVERLESISRQLGLKFMAGQSGFDWFISSDMFYLEVVLEASGNVKDVKIHHEGRDQQSCEELIQCLQNQDFNDFSVQLESLTSIYQLNAEKKVKSKAFAALQSLEADLITLASLQNNIKDPFFLIHKSPVGALHKRRGGHAMMLTYFVSPYDLLDLKNKISKPLSTDSIDIGYSVTVSMESSGVHKLQITTLVTVNVNPSGKSTPVYGASTPQNTTPLPACFVLKLSKPIPMAVSLVKKIQAVTEMECTTSDLSSACPLLSLIIQHGSDKPDESVSNKPLFVSLPDQNHCYFLTENPSLEGILVTSIPFTHPSHVSQILLYLRQQALFNSLLTSCIRHTAKPADFEDLTMFEITPLSVQHLSISFEHPVEESLATAELDLTDIGALQCNVFAASTTDSSPTTVETSEFASKVLQRCFSIPITMRSLIKSWQSASAKNSLNMSLLNGGGSLSLGGLGDISMGDPGIEPATPAGSKKLECFCSILKFILINRALRCQKMALTPRGKLPNKKYHYY
uniref:Mediator of RNA polymerase II transcription subunit 1 n=1 Tax=Cacopsylla melanoneura TaxID=428564 RepID=A0A8D8LNG0_9HEMI